MVQHFVFAKRALSILVLAAGLNIFGCRENDSPVAKQSGHFHRPLLTGEQQAAAAKLEKKTAELRVQGRYEEAIPLAEELLSLRRELQGADWWETRDAERQVATLTAISRMPEHAQQRLSRADAGDKEAERFFNDGKLDEGIILLETHLAARRELLGPEHPEVALTMVDLASLRRAKDDVGPAEELLLAAMIIQEQQLGDRHPQVAMTMNRLGILAARKKDYDSAINLCSRALAMRRELLPEDHHEIATSSINLGNYLMEQGRLVEAEPLFEGALPKIRGEFGSGSPDLASAAFSTGTFLMARGNHAAAEPLYRESLAIYQRIYGQKSIVVFNVRRALALLLSRAGHYVEGEILLREVLNSARELGIDRDEIGALLNNLGLLLRDNGDYAQAESLFEDALAVYRENSEPNLSFVATTLGNLGAVHQDAGNLEDAEAVLREAVAIQTEHGKDIGARYRSASFNLVPKQAYLCHA